MRFNLDKAMGVHEQALYVRSRRNSMLASNIANVDTPNYKAKDIDFRSVLRNAAGMNTGEMVMRTHSNHIQPGGSTAADAEELFRYPYQPSLDGNTVDGQMEKAHFAQNTVQYQASMSFLTGKFQGLKKAIKGGQ
ncbi:MAG: flagellar basal body rod protein FlgB [Gammaproteobacteria bacterium]|nr:flagellar basal body rod protein FlgB [Gammaproteobacteria bacterium]